MSYAPLDYLTLGQAFGTLSGSKCQRHQTGQGAITSKAEVEGQPSPTVPLRPHNIACSHRGLDSKGSEDGAESKS